MASRRRTNVAGVTGVLCLARSATVRRRSRSDDATPGPNRAKTNGERLIAVLCVGRRGNSFPALVMPLSGTPTMAKARSAEYRSGRSSNCWGLAGRRCHAVQEPSTAPKICTVARRRQNLERDVRGMESRDRIQTLAGARHSQSKISKTSVGESDALSGVTETEALTISGRVRALASH